MPTGLWPHPSQTLPKKQLAKAGLSGPGAWFCPLCGEDPLSRRHENDWSSLGRLQLLAQTLQGYST